MSISKPVIPLLWLAGALGATMLVYQGWDMMIDENEPMLQGHDDTGYFVWLHSWVLDGDNDLANNLTELPTISDDVRELWLTRIHPTTGKVLNKYPVGWALMNWPVYQGVYSVHGLFSDEATGIEPIYWVGIWSFQLLIALLSLVITYCLLKRFFDSATSQWSLLVIWLASPLLYYQTSRLGLAHNQAYFLTVVLVWLSFKLKNDSRWHYWLLMGATSGMLLITRPTSVCYLVIPAWTCLQLLATHFRSEFKHLCVGVIAGTIPVLFQMWIWKEVYGGWLVFSYYGEPFYFSSPAILDSLLSDRHGLFNWHPLLLIGCVGWIIGTFRARQFPVSWLVSFIAILYLNSAWWSWWFGSSFGNRAYEGAIFFFIAGFGYLHNSSKDSPMGAMLLQSSAWIAIIWNIYLLSQYVGSQFDRSLPVT
ncbi:MAG: glycosyltransferase family 39 protein, partial [Verrucomicrobia bacterium]|nr:glycosyltransferase family 39 protein [Verrucomicrobiota bacterium]